MDNNRVAPMWQRFFCGLPCAGGAVALPVNAMRGAYHGWHGISASMAAAVGTCLFGCIALRGRLSGKSPGTEYVRFRRAPHSRKA